MNIKETIQSNTTIILQVSGADLLAFAHELATEVREQAIKDAKNFAADKLLSGKEAAAFCGVQFCTFWRWVKQGRIIPLRGAGNPRYRLSDIQLMMAKQNKVKVPQGSLSGDYKKVI